MHQPGIASATEKSRGVWKTFSVNLEMVIQRRRPLAEMVCIEETCLRGGIPEGERQRSASNEESEHRLAPEFNFTRTGESRHHFIVNLHHPRHPPELTRQPHYTHRCLSAFSRHITLETLQYPPKKTHRPHGKHCNLSPKNPLAFTGNIVIFPPKPHRPHGKHCNLSACTQCSTGFPLASMIQPPQPSWGKTVRVGPTSPAKARSAKKQGFGS